VFMSWVLMARWTEDLTLDFDPGEMLLVSVNCCVRYWQMG
jgi:hypothetical protein